MTTAVAYVRVSTEEQARHGVSLDVQEERVRAYCAAQGLDLSTVIREEGVSGYKPLEKRPGGGQLLEALRTGRAKHVVVLKLDRIFRNAVDALQITQDWDRREIGFHIIDLGLNSRSAVGRFFLAIVAAFAELERNLISERISAAMEHKRLNKQVYGKTPLGFRRVGKKLVEDATEMAIVRQIQDWRAEGMTLQAIATRLNKAGVAPKTGEGRLFHPSTIRHILQNPVYKSARP